jgi:lipoprotein-anchoring transpeptidase ErfK/SrfK
MKLRSLFLIALIPLIFSNCRSTKPGQSAKINDGRVPTDVRPEDAATVDAWKQKGNKGGFFPAKEALKGPLTPGNSGFVVDLDAQRTYLYQGSDLIAYSPIASGRKYYRTETGNYTIGQKDLNHRSTSYGNFVNSKGGTVMSDVQAGFDPTPPGANFQGSLMKYFMRLHHNGRSTAMGFHRGVLPGYPASHGCIRLPGTMAEWFYTNVPLGTPVAVRGVKNGIPIGKSQGRPRRSPKIHPSLKQKAEPAVPPAPESDIKTPEPAPSPAPDVTPAPAPAPDATPTPDTTGGDPAAAPPPGSN